MPSSIRAGRGRVRVSLDTLANDYPPDHKLTSKVQLFERRHLFQRWRERLGTSSANTVIWPMHVSERWGRMMRVIERKKWGWWVRVRIRDYETLPWMSKHANTFIS